MAHIWIDQSGISSETLSGEPHRDELNPIELFCSQVAAHALRPNEYMETLDAATFGSAGSANGVARQFGVSVFAFLVRALNIKKYP